MIKLILDSSLRAGFILCPAQMEKFFICGREGKDFAEIELADKEKPDLCGRSFFDCRLV